MTIANATCSPTACSEYNTSATIFNLSPNTFDYSYTASTFLPAATNAGITSSDTTPGSTALTNLLKWVRGQDTQNENGFQVAGADTDVRASIHGDILHARPVILNYAPSGSTTDNVYVFYGGNDGVFRAVKGGQAATDGKEQWAFVPKEFFPILKRQYDNSPPVLYPSTPSGLGATKRSYAWDGPIVSYVERNSSGVVTKAYVYLSARRGGRFIYALDVTSPTNPKILWRKGCTTVGTTTTCDTGYDELGQTWSTPAVGTVEASEANGHPVLMFGGGYDAASEDPEPPALTDTMGRAVFVVDAFDGHVIWSAGNTATSPTVAVTGMDFAVTADILALDRHQTGFIDRIYAADIGGNVWRIDTAGTTTASWAVHKLAALGNRTSGAAGRKFLFGPEAVFGLPGTFDAVVIGSGDREHPLVGNAANSTANRAYMLVDPNTGTTGTDVNITDSTTDLFDATDVARHRRPVGQEGLVRQIAHRREGDQRSGGRGERDVLRHEPAVRIRQARRQRRVLVVRRHAELHGQPRDRAALRHQLPDGATSGLHELEQPGLALGDRGRRRIPADAGVRCRGNRWHEPRIPDGQSVESGRRDQPAHQRHQQAVPHVLARRHRITHCSPSGLARRGAGSGRRRDPLRSAMLLSDCHPR